MGDVEVVYSWVTIDFTWESEDDREEAIANGTYIVENCLASVVKVHINHIMQLSSIYD